MLDSLCDFFKSEIINRRQFLKIFIRAFTVSSKVVVIANHQDLSADFIHQDVADKFNGADA